MSTAEREQKKRKLQAELAEIAELEKKDFVKDTIAALNYGPPYSSLHTLTLDEMRGRLEEARMHVQRLTTIIEKAYLNGKSVDCTCYTIVNNYGKCSVCQAEDSYYDR